LYDGAPALGGADLTLEVELLVVVLLELDPDWYVVVAVDVYPPSIAVLDPDVLVCVDPAIADEVNNNSNNIERYFIFRLFLAWYKQSLCIIFYLQILLLEKLVIY
jgi:hypothetical protein